MLHYVVVVRTKEVWLPQFVDISGGNTAGTTLGGLTSGTEYFFSIQAKNDQGRSEYLSPPILVTLKGETPSNTPAR